MHRPSVDWQIHCLDDVCSQKDILDRGLNLGLRNWQYDQVFRRLGHVYTLNHIRIVHVLVKNITCWFVIRSNYFTFSIVLIWWKFIVWFANTLWTEGAAIIRITIASALITTFILFLVDRMEVRVIDLSSHNQTRRYLSLFQCSAPLLNTIP